MINKTSITTQWIDKVSGENRNANKSLIEKVIWAFLLLEGLCKQNIPFVFKGGTSLMLYLESAKRFSIDIDIIYSGSQESFEAVLDNIITEQGFSRKEKQKRNVDSDIIKAHYKFYYPTLYGYQSSEIPVLLDVLFEENKYCKIRELPVESKFVPAIGVPINVSLPSIEDLLGDKLTAFAPETTGIPYWKGDKSMSLEIIKQLYDIGSLFDISKDMEIISTTFKNFVDMELNYRGRQDINFENVLDNIIDTSLCISSDGEIGEGDFKELFEGFKRIKNYIFSGNFNIVIGKTYAAKAAYLSYLIKNNLNILDKFSSTEEMINWTIEDSKYRRIQKLKKSNPEAYYYWYKVLA